MYHVLHFDYMDTFELAVSVVIPVLNEQDNVKGLHTELIQVLPDVCKYIDKELQNSSGLSAHHSARSKTITSTTKHSKSSKSSSKRLNAAQSEIRQLHISKSKTSKLNETRYEILFVDDGSTDETVKVLKKLPNVRVLQMRRNFGQTAALDAGIKASHGKCIVTLDGDGQNDPADIPTMVRFLFKNNLDVVCGWRKKRQDSPTKRFISSGARVLRSFLVSDGIHDSGCTLRVYRRECFDNLTLRGEMHRFIAAILKWRGFKVGEVAVHHRPRLHGTSKYSLTRTVKGFLDMLALWFFRKYASRPLHFMGGLGLMSFTAGSSLFLLLFILRVTNQITLDTSIWPLVAVFSMLFGIQMFVSGLIMDLVISNSTQNTYFYREL